MLYPWLFSEGPIPSWNTFAKTENPMPAGAFPFLGRADFTGLTNCSSFYVIPHGLCLFCNGGKYFTTWQKLKRWCSASWHAAFFRSTKHPLAHFPVCVTDNSCPGSYMTHSQCPSGCTSLSTGYWGISTTDSKFLSGLLSFFPSLSSQLSL